MAAQRRFGPILGAGVRVEEQEGDRTFQPAPLGVTCYVGVFERGDTGKLLSSYSKKDMERLVGGRIPESLAPDAAQDFWEHSQGAGELHLVRVTDGTETPATLTFFSRRSPRQAVVRLSAHNGGRWGGRQKASFGTATTITTNQVTTGVAMKANEYEGGVLYLDGVAGKSYQVIGNDAAGVVTVAYTADLVTDLGGSPARGYTIVLPRDEEHELAAEIVDGESNAGTEWGLVLYLNGEFVRKWPNLSTDPTSARYFVNVINDDLGNTWITAEDLMPGGASPTPADRPANFYAVSSALSTTTITARLFDISTVTASSNANPTVTAGTTTDAMQYPMMIVLHMTSGTAFTAHALSIDADPNDYAMGPSVGTGTVGTLFTPANTRIPPFTVTNGSRPLVSGDLAVLLYTPFQPGELEGGLIYPDPTNNPMRFFRVSANAHNTISIASGDLTHPAGPGTTAVTAGNGFMVVVPAGFRGGTDGLTGITDQHYLDALNLLSSPMGELVGQNKGLVKLGCPGVTATAVQKAGLLFADTNNWQYRVEIPDTVTDEAGAIAYINTTIGRSDFGKVHFPSFAYVNNPDKPGTLKLTTLTGAIHGREALVAKNYDGYQKAAAGVEVMYQLPRVLRLPVGKLNEEALNPMGINVVKKYGASFIIWGDRTISVDPAWKFAHQRELMSHYENRLRESFDWIVFGINDPTQQAVALSALRSFFLPEYGYPKRALRGSTFDEACQLKVDNDINTDATRAEANMFAEISLRLADTIERFIMRIGKAGIFESVA